MFGSMGSLLGSATNLAGATARTTLKQEGKGLGPGPARLPSNRGHAIWSRSIAQARGECQ